MALAPNRLDRLPSEVVTTGVAKQCDLKTVAKLSCCNKHLQGLLQDKVQLGRALHLAEQQLQFVVVKYFNYRKEVSFEILGTYYSFQKAKAEAKGQAECRWGNEVVKSVKEAWVYVTSLCEFTTGDGYDQDVYAVLSLPRPGDQPEDAGPVVMSSEEDEDW